MEDEGKTANLMAIVNKLGGIITSFFNKMY